MPDTRTERMQQIARDIEETGLYTSANSILAITQERDTLRIALAEAMETIEQLKKRK